MPLYEYQCSACGHQCEVLQKMSDPPVTHCPHCQQESMQRLISATHFQLKGSGWYETDFKNKPEAKTPKDHSANKDATDKKTEPSADHKADKPTSSKKDET